MTATTDQQKCEALLKQYEQAWQRTNYLDSSYTQLALLYIALLGAYITQAEKFLTNGVLVSACLVLVGICIIGAIWRLRKLIDQQLAVISKIEYAMKMVSREAIMGPGRYRTSSYLIIIIVVLTILSAFLTLAR
jgi:hypothetical protein